MKHIDRALSMRGDHVPRGALHPAVGADGRVVGGCLGYAMLDAAERAVDR